MWAPKSVLIYSVSPIYGKPGIYKYDCKDHVSKIIVKPENRNKYYPDGSDYFELSRITLMCNKLIINYFYVRDVDSPEFNSLRTKNNSRKVELTI